MDTKNFLQIDISNTGPKMINIHNIGLVENNNGMTRVTLNITDNNGKYFSFNINEDYATFTLRLAGLDK